DARRARRRDPQAHRRVPVRQRLPGMRGTGWQYGSDGKGGSAEDSGSRRRPRHSGHNGVGCGGGAAVVSSLADRIRAIVPPPRVGPAAAPQEHARASVGADPRVGPSMTTSGEIVPVLGGEWRGNVFVVERSSPPTARHGRDAVGTLAECLDDSSRDAALYTGVADSRTPFVFFDLETTGLNGGAGTQAFLVGTGWFDAGGAFATRQFLLTRYADERPMLDAVASDLAGAGTLVSFNGK